MGETFKPRFGNPDSFFDYVKDTDTPELRREKLHHIISNLTREQWLEAFIGKQNHFFIEHCINQHCDHCYTTMAEIGNSIGLENDEELGQSTED